MRMLLMIRPTSLDDRKGKRDVGLTGLAGFCSIPGARFRHLSLSIGSKQRILSVVVTVNSRRVFDNFSHCAELRWLKTIEWE